ncbi:MAG: DUF6339 family protein [Sutterella sp.]|nr:DUF6339 family protein [Sutterella sp.]
MKIYYIEKDALSYLTNNLPTFLPTFRYSTNEVFLKKWKESTSLNLFSESHFSDCEDFSLDYSRDEAGKFEAEQVKTVYSHLSFIDETTATQEQIWAAFCLKYFWTFTINRWGGTDKISVQFIKDHFLFRHSDNRKSFDRNAIARLWWLGKITYDETNSENPWWITEVITSSSDRILNWMGRSLSNNIMITRALCRGIRAVEKDGKTVDMYDFRDISKFLNALAGNYIIDCMSEDRLSEKITSELYKIFERKENSKTDNVSEVNA